MTDLSPLTAAHPAQAEPAHWQGGPRSSGCVLVVEDNAAIRLLVAQFLPMFGFSAKEAANGREALALMRADPHHYVLILLDLRLPGMDSPELLSEVHLIRPDLPVVIMTGYLRDKACEKMAGHKIAGYIHKPFTPDGTRQGDPERPELLVPAREQGEQIQEDGDEGRQVGERGRIQRLVDARHLVLVQDAQ